MAEASLAAARAEISDGMAIDAMTPMRATTMSSSIKREAPVRARTGSLGGLGNSEARHGR